MDLAALVGDTLGVPKDRDNDLAEAISGLTCVLARMAEQAHHEHNRNTILYKIESNTEKIMSAISDFAAKQKAFNDRQGAAIDAAVTSVTGLTEDVAELNRKITELQNSQGGVTPEDQALIDELETQGGAVATRLEGVAAALSALDAQTAPVIPPTT